jgi:hypothetical protein
MIKRQAFEGIPYMRAKLPKPMSKTQLFNYLKERVTYKHDPKGIELVHTPQSFFEDNYHGKKAHGDCDDFTALSIAALKAQGIAEGRIDVALTGRSKRVPRHIYLRVDDQPFDLTNDQIGEERQYPYIQTIPLKFL